MSASISKKQFEDYKSKGFNRIPIVFESLADLDTPLSVYAKLANLPYSYLLESVEGGERFGRYSIIGLPSKKVFKINGHDISIFYNQKLIEKIEHENPLDYIDSYLKSFKIPEDVYLPRYSGGLAGYFGYETIQYIEPKLAKNYLEDKLGLPDVLLMLSDEVIVIDNVSGKLFIVNYIDPSLDNAYENALKKIDVLLAKLSKGIDLKDESNFDHSEPVSEFGEDHYKEAVDKIKSYIYEGDVMQVVLSQRMSQPFKYNPLSLYRSLRSLNPSPYMFFYHMEDHFVVGASPEILVRLENKKVTVRPIAGTRPRGKDEASDAALEKDLLSDPKELAEHVQLMDLGRNDIGRVSRAGSVNVTDNMMIERYSHVMHIVSNVEGLLRENLSAMDVLKATFPAGTVSGAPKVRAMEIINELESSKRGVYAGAVGYLGFNGDMDVAIAIRTAVIKDNFLYVQAGAGVVADSIPQNEWDETKNKARAILRAVELVKTGLEKQ
ncbi:MAG: anthranilate synthase component I [Methylophilaceae bacterium]